MKEDMNEKIRKDNFKNQFGMHIRKMGEGKGRLYQYTTWNSVGKQRSRRIKMKT